MVWIETRGFRQEPSTLIKRIALRYTYKLEVEVVCICIYGNGSVTAAAQDLQPAYMATLPPQQEANPGYHA